MNIRINKYRNEIDGVRAIAVIAVIINHIDQRFLSSGYLGVDVFFVISGFVITNSLINRKHKNFKSFLVGFYERRLKRLIPALLVMILVTTFVICFINPFPRLALRTGFTALFGISNIYLFRQSHDYFSDIASLNPFLHTWSLGLEEQFYFLFPIIFWISGTSKNVKNISYLKNTLMILTFISVFLFLSVYENNINIAYYLVPFRFWEISLGSLLSILFFEKSKLIRLIRGCSPFIPFFSILIIFCLDKNNGAFNTFLIVINTLLLISCVKEKGFLFEMLSNKKFSFIGKLSYSLYLWHWPVITIAKLTIGLNKFTLFLIIPTIVFISLISYFFIEQPIRKDNFIFIKNKIYFLTFLKIAFLGLILLFLDGPLRGKLYSGKNNYASIDEIKDYFNKVKILPIPECRIKNNNIDYESCINATRDISSNGKVSLFVGDSHTSALISSIKSFSNQDNFIVITKGGCLFPIPEFGLKDKDCQEFSNKTKDSMISFLEEGDTIVITNYLKSHLGDHFSIDTRNLIINGEGNLAKYKESKISIFSDGVLDFLNRISDKKIKVILLGSNLRNTLHMLEIKEWFRPYPKNSLIKEINEAKEINYILRKSFEGSKLIFIDPVNIFAKLNIETIFDYYKYFIDGDHLNIDGSKILLKEVLNKINQNS